MASSFAFRSRAVLALLSGSVFVAAFASPRTADAGIVYAAHGWKWTDIVTAVPGIHAAGFTAVQISPHESSCSGGYGNGYDPYDFTSFESGFGTEAELQTLVNAVHAQGMQIYADMVMNHMGTRNYAYPRFSSADFHHNGGIQDFNNAWDIENEDLVGLNDLAQESPYVRGELWNYLVKTNDMGFDGYRFDAALEVPQSFWQQNIVNNTNAWGKFSFGETYTGNMDWINSYIDIGMAVTDYPLYFAMKNAFSYGGDLTQLDGAGVAASNGPAAVTFAENQDVGAPTNGALAYAFLATYPGYPVFWQPSVTDPTITNLVWIHQSLANGAYVNRWKEHDVFIFERQGNLLVGINQSATAQSRWVSTSWANTRLHDYASHSANVTTAADTRVLVSIPPLSFVMLAPG